MTYIRDRLLHPKQAEQYLLDMFPSSVLALGTTRLSSKYTNPLGRFRESVANAELDVGSDQRGQLDGARWGGLVGTSGINPNTAISNGNFVNTTGWTAIQSTLSAASNILTCTGDGTGRTVIVQQDTAITGVVGKKIYARVKMKVTNASTPDISLNVDPMTSGTFVVNAAQGSAVQNQLYTLSGIATLGAGWVGNVRVRLWHYYADAATANGKSAEIQEVISVDLTTKYPSLVATMTDAELKTWCDANISFYSNANAYGSVMYDQSPQTERATTNLTPTDTASWEQGALIASDGTPVSALDRVRTIGSITVGADVTYTYSVGSGYIARAIFYYTVADAFIGYASIAAQTLTVTTPSNCAKVKMLIAKTNLTDAIAPADVVTAKPQLELGATPTTWITGLTSRPLQAVQTTAANQPMIVMSGSLLDGVKFDDTNDSLRVTQTPVINDITNLTVHWVGKFNGAGGLNAGRIFEKSNGATLATLGKLFLIVVGMDMRLVQYFSDTSAYWDTPPNSIVFNKMYHIVLVYSNSLYSNIPIIYINGVSQTLTVSNNSTGTTTSDSAQDLYVGNRSDGIRALNGNQKEQVWWNRLFTPAEVSKLWQYAQKKYGITA